MEFLRKNVGNITLRLCVCSSKVSSDELFNRSSGFPLLIKAFGIEQLGKWLRSAVQQCHLVCKCVNGRA